MLILEDTSKIVFWKCNKLVAELFIAMKNGKKIKSNERPHCGLKPLLNDASDTVWSEKNPYGTAYIVWWLFIVVFCLYTMFA